MFYLSFKSRIHLVIWWYLHFDRSSISEIGNYPMSLHLQLEIWYLFMIRNMFLHLHFVTKTSHFLNSFSHVQIYSMCAWESFTLLMLYTYFNFERISSTWYPLHWCSEMLTNLSLTLGIKHRSSSRITKHL